MKSYLLFIFCLFCAPSFSYAQKNKFVHICLESWPPAQVIAENQPEKNGFIIDILSSAFKEKGYEIKIREMPYFRSISETERGNCDISPGVPKGVSKKAIYARTPVYKSQYVIFFNRKKKFTYTSSKSLDGLKVANVVGYDYSAIDPKYEAFVQDKKNQITVFTGDTAVQKAFQSLAAGQVDIFSEDYVVGSYIIKQIGVENEISITKPFGGSLHLFPIFNPKNKTKSNDLISIYESKMKEINTSQKYNDYLDFYDVKIFKE